MTGTVVLYVLFYSSMIIITKPVHLGGLFSSFSRVREQGVQNPQAYLNDR
jgi:hypothetical protein